MSAGQVIGSEILIVEKLDSSNLFLADLSKDRTLQDGYVVVTRYQYAGRGQDKNTWYSSEGKNILLSIFLNTDFIRTEEQFILNKFISLAILDYLKSHYGLKKEDVKIKWPNDIYAGENKLGGILIQNQVQGTFMDHSIIGIGLNINETEFPGSIPNPVSLFQISGKTYDIEKELQILLDHIDKRYLQLKKNDLEKINKEYLDSLFRFSEKHKYLINRKTEEGIIRGVSKYGKLILELYGEPVEFDLKEIEFVRY